MTQSGTVLIVCIDPDCLSPNVEHEPEREGGCMHCRTCGKRWREDDQDEHDRAPHKHVKKMKVTQ